MKSGVSIAADRSRNLEASLKTLTSLEVLVGIPADKGARKAAPEEGATESMTNAQIGYVQEKGSPVRNIPARPFLVPGVRKVKEPVTDQLRAAGLAALNGDSSGVNAAYAKAGIIAQNSVRNMFTNNDWPALADATLDKRPPAVRGEDGKLLRRKKSRRERGAINPLIDSGQLRKAISFIVRKRQG